ncbi:MAG: hypothetical protein AMS22_15765 [Thiotrichales bacterium SG8_50]|nr:MAG: hypothetical protein AMS22_15765 [Thiotrichales bacterium SG8_50]
MSLDGPRRATQESTKPLGETMTMKPSELADQYIRALCAGDINALERFLAQHFKTVGQRITEILLVFDSREIAQQSA